MKKVLSLVMALLFSGTIVIAQNVPDMLEDALGAVVTVGVYKTQLAKSALGFRGEAASETAYQKALDLSGALSSGSGFIIEKNGKKYIITNAHVIESASDEAESIFVFTINRKKYEARVLGGDSFYDLAVLEFVNQPGAEVSVMRFTSSDPRIGEKVFAIGNPLGEYPYSVSDGIISAKNRVRGGMTGKFGFLQTTATLIWGNSGGPLVNEKGDVVGVNSQIAFANLPDGSSILQQQINFALEANICTKLINDIINTQGRVLRAYLGVEIVQDYEYFKIGEEYLYYQVDALPVIHDVLPGAPAYGQLVDKKGYAITAVNGNQINNLEEVLGELEKVAPGQKVTLSLEKDYATSTVTISTGELTPQRLEQLSKHVMDKNADITMDYDHPQVAFTLGNNDMYYYEERENRQQYRQNHRSGNSPEKYFVLAAGIHTEGNANMWLVEDYQALGAALRLTGTAGSIDYYILPSGGSAEDVQVVRQYLSGNESVIQSTLWY